VVDRDISGGTGRGEWRSTRHVQLIVDLAYRILFAALIVRVIAAWFGMFRYSRWIRPAYILTDWMVEPIRRVVPPLGRWISARS